ncbi:hypothetical protein KSP40_PGU010827 [Platanthera guangdongensis]|uniref:Uncharacterized protein n=1 Tax=Platanthera guangdongensis TaxID=2320717 RepID=A0ABR2LI86_9ASPA
MENHNLKAEPPVAAGYIRSLVRQLSSSRPPEIPHPNSSDAPSIAEDHSPGKSPSDELPPQNPKKQVRRRLNATRPYQGKLLNMAEARREIVTALKFHRAAMKQAAEQLKQRPPPPQMMPAAISGHHSSLLSPLSVSDSLINFTFPTRPLGLNLNFQGFTNVETPLYRGSDCRTNIPLILHQQTLPSSSSSYYSCSSPTTVAPPATQSELPLHPVMGDEEMAEIILMSEMHDIEWNDTLNSVSMAWWSELLMAMEGDGERKNREGGYCHGDCLLECQMER